ncbi:hypothetical protein E5673_08220 [Sphingomonas sp. PAMC26645]|uniref:hypothetical protein n=1 Tax=Sphingomonas sp. PAMC26645 TaxID=2565555 RepID=UPI00109DAA01|nr:hypothetical protein [Sphingomonas sp. PAMC26645]QCB42218.1 hypothetical protein E5673_08220 [Sphingomonas sp. PAMC26645]
MIDVAQYKAEIAAIPGNSLIIPRAQIDELLNELETGQIAKRTLRRIHTIAAMSSSVMALAA